MHVIPGAARDDTGNLGSLFMPLPPSIHVVTHPLVQHKLTKMRDRETSSANFRRLLREIGLLLGYDATRDLPLGNTRIETPIEGMEAPLLDGKKLVIVPILRAGLGLAEGILDLVPLARMGHVGLYRDPRTLQAVEYYFKMPGDITDRDVIVCDPMLATAHSAIAAVDRLKETGARRIKMICILAAEPGARAFAEVHPDVPVFTAAVDAKLNDHGYIVPGLGDAGDRLFGTR
jgi:uracil phosphoribosyltransferase